MKQYIFLINDHSGSMSKVARAAARDYNATVSGLKKASAAHNIDTVVSVIQCGRGYRGSIEKQVVNSSLTALQPINESDYVTDGNYTPLYDSVYTAIEMARALPDLNDPEVSILIVATTDGKDNNSRMYIDELIREMDKQIATDRWTFAFRLPKGDARSFIAKGIPEGNVVEWDTSSSKGMEAATKRNDDAFQSFYAARATGTKATRSFYTSTANLTEAEVKQTLGDISAEVQFFPVAAAEAGTQIRDFVEKRLKGEPMLKGAAFYQLVKIEEKIQAYKLIAIRDKDTGEVFCGPEARQMVGLSLTEDSRVNPTKKETVKTKWQIFVQSTSVNRKVDGGTQLMYWPNVGKRFTEGKSAR